ncbi:histidine kinase [Microbacterium foliorum]|uniref:sensor histidine kinase n=1 Tax=Rothia terrae TaxID=396015 RepID=UPI0034361E49
MNKDILCLRIHIEGGWEKTIKKTLQKRIVESYRMRLKKNKAQMLLSFFNWKYNNIKHIIILIGIALSGIVLADIYLRTPFIILTFMSVYIAVLSIKHPYISGISYTGIFLLLAVNESLRNPLSVLCAVVVVGFVTYKICWKQAFILAAILWYLGSIDLLEDSFFPQLHVGSFILACLLTSGLVTGLLWKKQDTQHIRERELSQELNKIRQQATITTLHDSVASILTSAIFRAETIKYSSDLSEKHKKEAFRISEDLRRAISEVRALITTINEDTPFQLEKNGLSLGEHLKKFKQSLENYGFYVVEDIEYNLPILKMMFKGTSQLIFPELTSNILKYGKPKSAISIQIQKIDEIMKIIICNKVADIQSDSSMSTGLGLPEIQREVKRLGGECNFKLDQNVWTTTIYFHM